MNNMILTKQLLTLVLIGFSVMAAAQRKPAIKSVEFSKMSRGYEERVTITADSIHTWLDNHRAQKNPSSTKSAIDSKQWASLVENIQALNLREFSSLPSPTMKRATDAAMHGTITITTEDGSNYSHGFDDENPHINVMPLLKKIKEVSGVDKHR
jgi:hypothetical protein